MIHRFMTNVDLFFIMLAYLLTGGACLAVVVGEDPAMIWKILWMTLFLVFSVVYGRMFYNTLERQRKKDRTWTHRIQ